MATKLEQDNIHLIIYTHMHANLTRHVQYMYIYILLVQRGGDDIG